MKRTVAGQFLAIALISVLPFCLRASGKKEYKAKDGTRVAIVPLGKLSGHDDAESRIEFYSPQNQMLCALDYSSEDGEHGFGVVKAAWTPDQKYFVFSLTSSGGHQAWHAPTLFYSVKDDALHALDSYVDGGISKGDFVLKPPDSVLTEVWRGESHPIKFRLDLLTSNGDKSPRVMRCADGKIFKPEG
jgi:hypothetical protein